jgi:hypothetical protein
VADQDVSVIAWGEFSAPTHQQICRTRPLAQGIVRPPAGGGMRMGQVIGSTNRLGEEPQIGLCTTRTSSPPLITKLGIDVQNT